MSKKVIITWAGIADIIGSLETINSTVLNYRNSIPPEHEEASKKVITILEHRINKNNELISNVRVTLANNRLLGGLYKAINTEDSNEYITFLNEIEEANIETAAMIETILSKIGERVNETK